MLSISEKELFSHVDNSSVESEKITAETNAHTNKTSFKKEMSKIFEANGVENEKQLFEKFLDEEATQPFTSDDQLFDPNKYKIQEEMAQKNKQYNDIMQQNKLASQKNYKQFLDHREYLAHKDISC